MGFRLYAMSCTEIVCRGVIMCLVNTIVGLLCNDFRVCAIDLVYVKWHNSFRGCAKPDFIMSTMVLECLHLF